MNKFKNAFTMAEALSVLILLGVVAAITIPATVNRMTVNQNRAKLKKALATYDSAVRLIVSENRIKNKQRLDDYISANNCQNIYRYFKAVESNGCQFKTTDGVWWDVGTEANGASMSKTLVSFNRRDLTQNNAFNKTEYKAFYFVSDFDTNHSLRIMDLGYFSQTGKSVGIINTAKINAFINNKKINDYYKYCGNNIEERKSCIFVERYAEGLYSTAYYEENGNLVSWRNACNSVGVNCTSSGGG